MKSDKTYSFTATVHHFTLANTNPLAAGPNKEDTADLGHDERMQNIDSEKFSHQLVFNDLNERFDDGRAINTSTWQ